MTATLTPTTAPLATDGPATAEGDTTGSTTSGAVSAGPVGPDPTTPGHGRSEDERPEERPQNERPAAASTGVRGGSAYPPAVDALRPRARELADRLGRMPSRNAVMRELRIGAEKAKAVLAELANQPTGKAGTSLGGPVTAPAAATGHPVVRVPASADPAPQAAPAAPAAPAEPIPSAEPAPVAAAVPPAAPAVPVVVAGRGSRVRSWPVLLLALPAFVAIWSGWVGLGGLTGFGVVHPLPGIWDGLALNTAITLPIGMETYAAFALRAWLSPVVPVRARRFAGWSALASLGLGAAGQVAYHLMSAAGMTAAPWQITTVVACLPVAVLGMGAALAHLLHTPPATTQGRAE